MKAFYRTTIALCLSLAILFLTVGSAAAGAVANETLQIRGPVYNGGDLTNILSNPAYGGTSITMNADKLATFYLYDDNVTTETLSTKEK